MDVEGAEYGAIRGMLNLLTNNEIELLIELHSWGDPNLKKYSHDVLLLMKKLKFNCFKTYEHYYFSKENKGFYRCNYSYEIIKWWLKHKLRKVGFLRQLKAIIERFK